MSQQPVTFRVPLPNRPVVTWIAKYTATATVILHDPILVLNDTLPEAQTRQALSLPPEWTQDPWDDTETDPTRLALNKLKALFDFDAQLEANSSGDIARELDAQFAGVARLRQDHASAPVPGLKVFRIAAMILDDGKAEWEVFTPGPGALPPDIPNQALDSGSPLKMLLQNLVRADLLSRLGR